MSPTSQPSSPSLKNSGQKAATLLIQLAALFILFLSISSFMLIVLSNFGLNYIDSKIYPIIPKHYRDGIVEQKWNDSNNNQQHNHGVLYCPLKYETLSEEVAEAWHSARNYYECPVPIGQRTSGDNDVFENNFKSIWNLAGQSGISRVVCCENNRCCTTHQWMDFTLFYSIMSHYAPWPVILLILMLFTTLITISFLTCIWHIICLGRSVVSKTATSNVSTHSPTLSEMDSLFLEQCNTGNTETVTDGVIIINSSINNNNVNNITSAPSSNGSSNGSSTGSQSTATTGCMAELHSRTNSSLSMSTLSPHNRIGHVSLMTPPPPTHPIGANMFSSFEHPNNFQMNNISTNFLTQYGQNTMSLARNSLSFQPHSLNHHISKVPNASLLPSPTEVPKVNLASTYQWKNNSSRHYESMNAHDLNLMTNDII